MEGRRIALKTKKLAQSEQRPPQLDAQLTVKWPESRGGLHPYQIAAMTGWHSVEETGHWDIEAMFNDLRPQLIHSESSGKGLTAPNSPERQTLIFTPKKNLFITVVQHVPQVVGLKVWSRRLDQAETEFAHLRQVYFRKRQRQDDPNKAEFFVVTVQMGELQARVISTRSEVRTAGELQLNYGEEFLDWHLHFLTQLKTVSKGLVILRGEAGTGKTSYLRHLMCELRFSHRFYFLPVSAYALLNSPSTVDFWLNEDHRHSALTKICIIEDSETLLIKRASDNQESVSTLLNLADGFLGEALKLILICTVNAPIDQLDPAVVRPGRLIAYREFRRLSPSQAQKIANARQLVLKPQNDFTLGEIYHTDSSQHIGKPRGKQIGFGMGNFRSRCRPYV